MTSANLLRTLPSSRKLSPQIPLTNLGCLDVLINLGAQPVKRRLLTVIDLIDSRFLKKAQLSFRLSFDRSLYSNVKTILLGCFLTQLYISLCWPIDCGQAFEESFAEYVVYRVAVWKCLQMAYPMCQQSAELPRSFSQTSRTASWPRLYLVGLQIDTHEASTTLVRHSSANFVRHTKISARVARLETAVDLDLHQPDGILR